MGCKSECGVKREYGVKIENGLKSEVRRVSAHGCITTSMGEPIDG